MKICSISMVKDEADIIESFVRFGLSFLDYMVILDNGSTDNTGLILEKLKAEGKNIEVISHPSAGYDQALFMNELLAYASEKYSPDFIIPLDADEFLDADCNPRDILSRLPPKYAYTISWRTYLPRDGTPLPPFLPFGMAFYRDARYENFKKVIIPCEVTRKYAIRLATGNHKVFGIGDNLVKNIESLRMGHFPIRSREQFQSKVILGVIRHMCNGQMQAGMGMHLMRPYCAIKYDNQYDLFEEALNFANFTNAPFTLFHPGVLNTEFCGEIDIRYADLSNVSYLKNILGMCESMADLIHCVYQANAPEKGAEGLGSLRRVLQESLESKE